MTRVATIEAVDVRTQSSVIIGQEICQPNYANQKEENAIFSHVKL